MKRESREKYSRFMTVALELALLDGVMCLLSI